MRPTAKIPCILTDCTELLIHAGGTIQMVLHMHLPSTSRAEDSLNSFRKGPARLLLLMTDTIFHRGRQTSRLSPNDQYLQLSIGSDIHILETALLSSKWSGVSNWPIPTFQLHVLCSDLASPSRDHMAIRHRSFSKLRNRTGSSTTRNRKRSTNPMLSPEC
jgi:hypothetical protein